MQVVDRIQNLGQQFVRGIEMAQVSPRITPANAALASWIKRALVLRVAGLLDRHLSFRGKQQSMPGGAGGKHTIHHVNTRLRVLCNFLGSANPHPISRLVGGKMLKREKDNVASKSASFANAKPADSIPRKA